jgi:hypothetical protein
LALLGVFFGEPLDPSKEGVRHACNWQLDNNGEPTLRFLFMYKKRGLWKTMENDHHFILNFIKQWTKYLGVKFISSGLGAILNAVPLWIVILLFL